MLGRCSSNDNPRYFHGKMKGIKVYGRMLSSREVQVSYWKGGGDTGNPTTPVIAEEPEYSPATINLISWEASTDDISGVAGYMIQCKNNSTSEIVQDTISITSHIFTGLEHGISYSYKVAARDSADNVSGWTSWVTSIQDTLQPTQPVMNSEPAYSTGTSNTVFWSASTDGTSDVSYWVQCATDTIFSDTLDLFSEAGWILETNYKFTGLQIGNTYYYRVKARDEAGNESDTSNVVSSTQDDGSQYNTYYVSPFGDDGTGVGSINFPWRNIQTAINNASSGDIIKVIDDNDSTTVDYEEYNGSDSNGHIVIYKRITIERYDDDNTRPQIKALYYNYNIFYINSDSVTIKDLDIYGTIFSIPGPSGIYLYESSDCIIENNRCGWDNINKNYYGIYLCDSNDNIIRNNICSSNTCRGIYLENSDNNTISGNICKSNTYHGIRLNISDGNFIYNNTCNTNPNTDIHLNSSGYNTISGNNSSAYLFTQNSNRNNISGNNFYKLYVYGYCLYNTVAGNTISADGSLLLHSIQVINNRFYFNNVLGAISTTGSDNIWNSPTKIGYIYGGSEQTYKNYLGNFWSAYAGSDIDNDGIGEESFTYGSYITDNYPLMASTDNYSLQAWWLANSIMYRGDLSKQGGIVGINTGSSHIWVSDQMTLQDIEFQAGNQSDETSWTGHITFTTTPSSVDSIIIEIGYTDDQNGNGFSAQGPQARLSGLDFDNNIRSVAFATTAQSFTIPQGKYLAMKLTNYGAYYYSVRVGGSWSFIQAPLGSQDYTLPVELSSFTAVYTKNESGNDFVTVKWDTASETDVIGFNIYRSEYDDIGTVGNHINSYLIPGHGSTSDPHSYLFEDLTADVHILYNYWLEVADFGGISEYYGPIKYIPGDIDGDQVVDLYDATKLFSNYPNPVVNSTTIKYQLKGSVVEQDAIIKIYNILGELVKIVKGKKGKAELDVSDLATGIYLYQLKTTSYNEVKKLIIVR
ncbi:MAG: right-handed parallel beta-helix repeat-containing protein [Candidatus Cloacimonetes bacterium]|nr:right-handed parallel beta-helix repeat-containing protein [Candidatus Cloacimonadota bacterium]